MKTSDDLPDGKLTMVHDSPTIVDSFVSTVERETEFWIGETPLEYEPWIACVGFIHAVNLTVENDAHFFKNQFRKFVAPPEIINDGIF